MSDVNWVTRDCSTKCGFQVDWLCEDSDVMCSLMDFQLCRGADDSVIYHLERIVTEMFAQQVVPTMSCSTGRLPLWI